MSSPPGTTLRVPTLPGHDFNLPRGLEGLDDLAYNLWWSWTPRAGALFSRLDPAAWARHRNPIAVLAGMDAGRWEVASTDEEFLVDASRLLDEYHRYMGNGSDSWYQQQIAADPASALPGPIGYFCAEYGFHESMQIYSGGLGVLAGDHCKSASDAALPFIGVGLLYRRGYFRQQIDADGHQEHAQPDLDPAMLPLRRARGPPMARRCRSASTSRTARSMPPSGLRRSAACRSCCWTPISPPTPDRTGPITHILYVRGREMRLCQELILGVGGVRALGELGIEPAVWHLNEGHSAFLLLERAREAMAEDGTLSAADRRSKQVGRDAVFTIHTPVAAGNETFDRAPGRRTTWRRGCTSPAWRTEELLELGRGRTDDPNAPFDMTAFVLRHASHANAVSRLHARDRHARPGQPVAGHPITADHQRRPRRHPGWAGRCGGSTSAPWAPSWPATTPARSDLAGVSQIDDADLWAGTCSRSGS